MSYTVSYFLRQFHINPYIIRIRQTWMTSAKSKFYLTTRIWLLILETPTKGTRKILDYLKPVRRNDITMFHLRNKIEQFQGHE